MGKGRGGANAWKVDQAKQGEVSRQFRTLANFGR
jgi:hypothetical protein